ncbi:hypothetical protein CXB51_003241 [Gossypium anomalum]|uniref:Homeobox domain-containing protein n=1 Tax=Gossypium anomalum TaxID=47600 RepID=A0A8J5ZPD7_9ROSI|nr:hypothetical protein CXB51_003241 [Gossypium anomalum]
MATYFHGNPEIQASTDGLQTLVLMNPAYVQYSDTPPPPPASNLLFFNLTLSPPRPNSATRRHPPPGYLSRQSRPYLTRYLPLHGLVQRVHYKLQQPGYGTQAQAVSGGSASSGSGVHNRSELLAKKGGGGNNHSNSSSKAVGESSVVAAEAREKHAAELTTAEKQEIHEESKAIPLPDADCTSSFEQAAGIGSAKTYTALALKTISKQFRCLKDAITDQIRAANKSLGEEEDGVGGAAKIEGSRLKFVDHHLRQQRALQQLGMIQHNAWRPQRGLPERSVSVLRAWLFEHFLHPYPKDSDKHMLAKQTGLTRSQVSNWFINARVRLWKPMVEEMYLEEIKEQEQNGTSDDKTSKTENHEDSASKSTAPSCQNPGENQKEMHTQSRFSLIGSSELEGITQGSPKKPRSNELLQSPTSVPSMNMDMNQSEASNEVSMKFSKAGYSFMGTNTDFMGGFGQYPIGEIGRFDAEQFAPRFPGNGVSLTLGLPHCENLSLSGTHQNFLPNQTMQMGRRLDIDEPNEFGDINPPNLTLRLRMRASTFRTEKGL